MTALQFIEYITILLPVADPGGKVSEQQIILDFSINNKQF